MIYRAPTVGEYLTLKYSDNSAAVVKIAQAIAPEIGTIRELTEFLSGYLNEIETEKAKNPELNVPFYPSAGAKKQYYTCGTGDMKLVCDYTRLNFAEILRTDIFTFWRYLHDAVVWECSRSESGREYLENAYFYNQTEPDRKALNAMFGGEKHGG